MDLKLIVASLVIATTSGWALAQSAVTNEDAQQLVDTISGDQDKTQTYCDIAKLRDQIARLQRSSHRLIWLNPLIGTADYAPLTRGLQAALPFVDDFLPARTLINLADLAIHLNALA